MSLGDILRDAIERKQMNSKIANSRDISINVTYDIQEVIRAGDWQNESCQHVLNRALQNAKEIVALLEQCIKTGE
jgi:uncharacterized protein (DUF1778 family)